MKPVVSMAPAQVVTITQGKASPVPLSFRVAKGYHINSNKPKSEFLIPTALKIGATTDIVIGGIAYPEGHDMSFAFAPDEKLNVYTGDFELDVSVRPLRSVQRVRQTGVRVGMRLRSRGRLQGVRFMPRKGHGASERAGYGVTGLLAVIIVALWALGWSIKHDRPDLW